MSDNALNRDVCAAIEEAAGVIGTLGEELAAAMQEADRECRTIGIAFRRLTAANRRTAAMLPKGHAGEMLRENCAEIDAAMSDAIVALQYQDLLAQRVLHIRASLGQLQADLRVGGSCRYEEWLERLRGLERQHEQKRQHLRQATVRSDSTVEIF